MEGFVPAPPPTLDERVVITEMMRAVRSYVCFVLHHWSSDPTKPLGTAVMLRAGNRLFAVTAEHCVSDDILIRFRMGDHPDNCSRIVNTMRDADLDIAVLELEDRPDVVACNVRQLEVELPKQGILWIAGYPSKMARLSQDGETLRVTQMAFAANIMDASETEIGLYYPVQCYGVDPNDLTCMRRDLPASPHGFSGGGVWGLKKYENDALFNPLKHIKLLGIQKSWGEISRRIRCVPSGVITAILAKNYPDLRPLLSSLFPDSTSRRSVTG